tara:strand:+ start:441 stop:1064 length:624 start_codon:yes stop_codon:yes gene_type:complete
MAKGKKSFVLYTDQIGIFSKLTDEQAGLLIKHIYAYCNDEEPKGDFVTELAFESIKQALKRDLRKFEDVKVKRSEAGKKSAEVRKKQKSTKSTSVKSVQQSSTKSTVSVNDSVNVNVSVNEKVNDILKRKQSFRQSLTDFNKENLNKYPKQLFIDFEMYWTEHGPKDKKMRFEKEKTFGIASRLSTWFKRDLQGTYKAKVKRLNTFD